MQLDTVFFTNRVGSLPANLMKGLVAASQGLFKIDIFADNYFLGRIYRVKGYYYKGSNPTSRARNLSRPFHLSISS